MYIILFSFRLYQGFPNDKRIDEIRTIRQTRSTRHTTDDLESQILPDFDGSNIILKDEVKHGVFVSLPRVSTTQPSIPKPTLNQRNKEKTYQLRRHLQINLSHNPPNTTISRRGSRKEPGITNMRAASYPNPIPVSIHTYIHIILSPNPHISYQSNQ